MTNSGTDREMWVPALTFAAKLALIRHQMRWNIKQAAIACGLPPQSWRGWELQRRLPHDIRQVARQIAERTGVDLDWLLWDGQVLEADLTAMTKKTRRPAVRDIAPYSGLPDRRSVAGQRPPDNRPPARPEPPATIGVRRTAPTPRTTRRDAA